MIIKYACAHKIMNSRGAETVEVDIITRDGLGRDSAPSWASKGQDFRRNK